MAHPEAHLPPPRRQRRWGSQRKMRDRLVFDALAGALAAAMISAWTASIVSAYRDRSAESGGGPSVTAPVTRSMSAALTDPRARSTAYLEDAVEGGYLGPLRGSSGKLRAVFRTPGEELGAEEADPHFAGVVEDGVLQEEDVAPADPGIYKLPVDLGRMKQPV